MAQNLSFYYFGDDEAYFRTLQGRFKDKTPRLTISFNRFFESEENKIQSLFLKVYEKKPNVVFIDLSTHTPDYLHLLRLLMRTQFDHQMIVVGLVDYLSPKEILKEAIAMGAHLCHIKSAEVSDVIFDVARIIAPEEMPGHQFAVATLADTLKASILAKVGYIHQDGIHIESNYPLSPGLKARVNHQWQIQPKIIPSSEVMVKSQGQSNLYYQYQSNFELAFSFVDDLILADEDPAKVKERMKQRNEAVLESKYHLKKWIQENASNDSEKKAKVLVVDDTFTFYKDQKRTDRHPYTIRCIPYLRNSKYELEKLHPQVIAYALDNNENGNNSIYKLQDLVSLIKTDFKELDPFIVVFNCDIDSKVIQEKYSYSHIMTTSAEFSVDVLVKMAELFNKKLSTRPQVKGVKKVFLKKTDPASLCEIEVEIKVIKLSESDLIFQTTYPIPIGANLKLSYPVDMLINVQPMKAQGKVPEFHGLIHGLGENSKKELRRFVNTIFFRDHDARLLEETEAFKQLNETRAQEKQQALDKVQAIEKAIETEEAKLEEEKSDIAKTKVS